MKTRTTQVTAPAPRERERQLMRGLCHFIAFAALSSLAGQFGPTAWAASKQQNLPVQAQVALNCSFQSAPTLNFLTYDPNGANNATPLDQTTTIKVSCTKGATATAGIDTGTHPGQATIGTRALGNGPKYLGYDLYQDPTRTLPWTNSGAGLYTFVSTDSAPASLNLYGRIFAGQNVPAGIYTDTLIITINY